MINKITLLEEEQIFGNNQLEIFKKIGIKAAVTDYAILTGAFVSDNYTLDSDNSLKGRRGYYWTKTTYGSTANAARVVDIIGSSNYIYVIKRYIGVRPALPYSSISDISPSGGRSTNKNSAEILELGYFPQNAVPEEMQGILNDRYQSGLLVRKNVPYAFDLNKEGEVNLGYNETYEYDGKLYARVLANSYLDEFTLSNGVKYKKGDYVWVEVSPVRWYNDEETNTLVAEKILMGGIPFEHTNSYNGDFENTDMYSYLTNVFSKEIFNYQENKTIASFDYQKSNNEGLRRENPYNFSFEDVSEVEIMKGAIISNIPVFMHGESGEGKSARVKQIDPDCQIIYLANESLDSLNGKSVYVPPLTRRVDNEEVVVKEGHMLDIKPSWLVKLEEKCQREPNKIHIVFFDELTNAPPSIQGMAFNIILEKEVNGKWKLPENARIVAAGNELKDSLAANQMAEPLFNRFAHVYIKTTVDSWLKWASMPRTKSERIDYNGNKEEIMIHPAIYAYIAYKSYSNSNVLRTKYTGDKPNADPRKWEMASDILYKTNKPGMLRALVGESITRDFIEFTKKEVITVEDVINERYNERDLEMDVSQKFQTAVGLSSVDEKNFKKVREFMKKVGPEPKATFESIWAHGDEKRLEMIAEIQMEERIKGGIGR